MARSIASTRMQKYIGPSGCGSREIYFLITHWDSNGIHDTIFSPAGLCELRVDHCTKSGIRPEFRGCREAKNRKS